MARITLFALIAALPGCDGGASSPATPATPAAPSPTPSSTQALPISGPYRLSLTVAAQCQPLFPRMVHHRVYEVTVRDGGNVSAIEPRDTRLVASYGGEQPCALCGYVEGGRIVVKLNGFDAQPGQGFFLGYMLNAAAGDLAGQAIMGNASAFVRYSEAGYATTAECWSMLHDFALLPGWAE